MMPADRKKHGFMKKVSEDKEPAIDLVSTICATSNIVVAGNPSWPGRVREWIGQTLHQCGSRGE